MSNIISVFRDNKCVLSWSKDGIRELSEILSASEPRLSGGDFLYGVRINFLDRELIFNEMTRAQVVFLISAVFVDEELVGKFL